MKKTLIRLTESDLHNIIKESVNKILKEEFQITLSNTGNEGFQNMKNWVASMNELITKGETIIHIPLSYDNILHAHLYKNENGTYQLDTKGLNKSYVSAASAFEALKWHAEDLKKNMIKESTEYEDEIDYDMKEFMKAMQKSNGTYESKSSDGYFKTGDKVTFTLKNGKTIEGVISDFDISLTTYEETADVDYVNENGKTMTMLGVPVKILQK